MRRFAILRALARLYFRTVARDWYRRPPFLPLPPPDYLRWRLRTAYGRNRPAWSVVLADLWQFGAWLASFPATHMARAAKKK